MKTSLGGKNGHGYKFHTEPRWKTNMRKAIVCPKILGTLYIITNSKLHSSAHVILSNVILGDGQSPNAIGVGNGIGVPNEHDSTVPQSSTVPPL